jgi:hypothetical protein
MSADRLLVHAPCLRDLTDFLYFDKVVYPATTAYVRPRTLAPGYVGYPLKEPLPEPVRARLSEAGLITSPGVLVAVPAAGDLTAWLAKGIEGFMAAMQQSAAAAGAALGDLALATLDTPATDAEVVSWIRELDGKAKALADLLVKRGHRAAPKLHAEDVTWTLRAGWTPALSVTFHELPCLRPSSATFDAMLAFLGDAETKRLRSQLFGWLEDVASTPADRGGRVEDVPERIGASLTAYTAWIAASGLASGTTTAELLIACDAAFIQAVSELPARAAHAGEVRLARRGLAPAAEGPAETGRELAWISHAKRDFRVFWPG